MAKRSIDLHLITLKNLSIFSIFGLSGFTKQVCEPVKKMRAKKVNKSCDIEENKHLKKVFAKISKPWIQIIKEGAGYGP